MNSRRRIAAALAVLTIGAAAALIGTLGPAQAAAPTAVPTAVLANAAVAVPITTSTGGHTLVVDPTTDLADSGATIRVQGTGFSTENGLYVAVCADGSGAPANLSSCVGGSVPDGNGSESWAHITESGEGDGGGVKARWGEDGSFDVTLTLSSVTGGGVNCVSGGCSLFTASDDGSVRTEDTAVAVTFAGPPTSSSSAPSTPGTAIPQVIQSPEITPGGTQLVVFSGFEPNEQVALTLFSLEVTLSPVDADGTGVARAEFTVPSDFAIGGHRLEAVGQNSGTVGVASFEVVAPPTTPSSSPSSPPSSSPSSSSSSSSSSPSVSSVSSSLSSSAPTTSSSSTAAPTSDSSSLWWLWLILAVVLIGAIITGIVVYRRNQQIARERDQYERDRAAAAAAGEQPPPEPDPATVFLPPVPPPPGSPPPGADPYGLLSGRDEPYPGPTDVIVPGGPTQVIGPPPGYRPPPAPPGEQGPPTDEIPTVEPTPAGPTGAAGPAEPAGPTGPGADSTSAWTPDFDDTQPPAGGSQGDTGDAEGDGPPPGRRG